MRGVVVAFLTLLLAMLGYAAGTADQTCALSLSIVDSTTGLNLPGLVRIRDAGGTVIKPAELLPRGMGLNEKQLATYGGAIDDWCVLPKAAAIRLPRNPVTIEAFSGLETELATATLDLSEQATRTEKIPLVRFADLRSRGLRSANTHLHLMKLRREDAERYLTEVPQGDDLDMLFVSYLERAGADQDYISNQYGARDLTALERKSGVLFGNGEEHRHNFEGYGEGYGHVMFLNIQKLIQPVSIGPGIMKSGTDGLPLARGIQTARDDGATVVWCHNDMGREALPNFLAGRIQALNIFDGSINSTYSDSFYRYLNAGLRVPFSTGTDWFQYDFSRVYVDVEGLPTVEKWLTSLANGRSFISNGPLLEFEVAKQGIGSTVALTAPGTVHVEARAQGRADFKQIELVLNGDAKWSARSRKVGGHFEATLSMDVPIDGPAWLALRTPPPPTEKQKVDESAIGRNEFGRALYAHTSPVYVEVAGKSRFDEAVARQLLKEMEADRTEIARIGKFADEQEKARVLDVYTDGIREMERRLATR